MCGRFALIRKKQEIVEQLELDVFEPEAQEPAYNIAPTTSVPVVVQDASQRIMRGMRWGLVPHWAKEISIGQKMINARVETLHEKASFRELLGRQHCAVAMDAYFEWKRQGGARIPYMIERHDHRLLLAAGLWDRWQTVDGILTTFTIITRDAVGPAATVHDRMPLLFEHEDLEPWLAASTDGLTILDREPKMVLELNRISDRINSVRNVGPDCVERVPDQLEFGF